MSKHLNNWLLDLGMYQQLYLYNSVSRCLSCRFIFGADHGRLKFGPPEEHAPVVESLPPKEKLKIEPCFYFGEIMKNIISGPTEMCEYQPFVPNPVSTSHVSTLECVQEVFVFCW